MALPEAGSAIVRGLGFRALTNGCYWRRNAPFTITAANREVGASFSLPCSPGEGRLTERTPAVRPWLQERVFVPHTCRSPCPSGAAQLGGNRPFTPDFCAS